MMSHLEALLALQIRAAKLPKPEQEYKFHPGRGWLFDMAYPEQMTAIECEGGTWAKSRHTSGLGFERDCEKYNEATLMGWRVLRFTSTQIKRGEALKVIERALNAAQQ